MREIKKIIAITTVALFLSSCDTGLINSNNNNNQISSTELVTKIEDIGSKLSDDPVVRDAENYLHELSDEIDDFGGAYLNRDGELVVKIKNSGSYQSRAASIKSTLENKMPEFRNSNNFKMVEAGFRFDELIDVRDKLYANLDALNINFLDLAEDQNIVILGTETKSYGAISDFLEIAEIPSSSVKIQVMEQTEPLSKKTKITGNYVEKYPLVKSNSSSTQTLESFLRPTLGGTKTYQRRSFNNQIYPNNCSLGFNAEWNGKNVFLTNSHCTETGSPDSEIWEENQYLTFHLPSKTAAPTSQGLEVLDPFGTSTGCDFGDKCRYSDSAIIEYKNISSSNIGFGKIAKTTYRGINWTNGGKDLLSTQVRWRIVSQNLNILLNMPLNKVGYRTGWTHGYVSNTCVVENNWISNSGKNLICQYLVSGMKGAKGDSGAPVFFDNDTPNSDVTIAGILYGLRSEEEKIAFSPISGIEQDLGTFNAADKPISTNITGPVLVENTGNHTWNSNVQDQEGSVSYQWKIKYDGDSSFSNLGTSSSQSVFVTDDTDFTLKLIVNDSLDSDEDIQLVNVNLEGCSPTNPCGGI